MTDIRLDGKPVKHLDFHLAGDDGEFLWVHFETTDGKKHDTWYLKGSA
jgi:hypothetical protein